MTKEEAKILFKRIKSHYNTFVIDDFKFKEWFKELEHCNFDDVNKNLDAHINSEIYGANEPRLLFLIKYCRRDDRKFDIQNLKLICPHCKNKIKYFEYEDHIHRHNSIYYMNQKSVLLNKHYNEAKLMLVDENLFEEVYNNFLKELYQYIEPGPEKDRIKFLLNLQCKQMTINEFMGGEVNAKI